MGIRPWKPARFKFDVCLFKRIVPFFLNISYFFAILSSYYKMYETWTQSGCQCMKNILKSAF